MSIYRRAAKVDANQAEIVDGLRRCGVKVWVIGRPCDLLTRYRGKWLPLECKDPRTPKRKDQPEQDAFLCDNAVPIVRTLDDALLVIGARRAA